MVFWWSAQCCEKSHRLALTITVTVVSSVNAVYKNIMIDTYLLKIIKFKKWLLKYWIYCDLFHTFCQLADNFQGKIFRRSAHRVPLYIKPGSVLHAKCMINNNWYKTKRYSIFVLKALTRSEIPHIFRRYSVLALCRLYIGYIFCIWDMSLVLVCADICSTKLSKQIFFFLTFYLIFPVSASIDLCPLRFAYANVVYYWLSC